ncbi:hypothetical protein DUI87_12073 [Hirundo rustica rustica]|uniref:Reverse transcriptase domain-containing protein n=1 Tax=Hirundo rustica rustica TaxID=333673 RepID=A0A3M0J285_HIRRU|nr:hypothetical protein DUI87_30647 [Hirundo rustica rustica]RMC11160.1 hypothetical protein DUI87_12073 [Hirundo rustica rustica]
MFWGFINNCTQFVRGGVGDEALQPLLSFFSFESVTSLLENVQGLLNVKDTTFLVFHLVTFLYMVYSFSRMSHTPLNTVRQQIEAREQGDKSAIQAAAKPDSEAKTPAVAAVKKGKKHTDKTDRPVDDDSGEESSMPPDTQSGVKPPDTPSEAEATDDTQSEAEPTDTKSEAKSTGTRSGAQPTAARAGAQPTAARAGDTIESFSLKDLRGLRKDYTRRPDESIINDINTRNPDLVPCTPVMWRKLVRLGPQEYSSALAIIKRDETEETVLDMAKKLRTYADAVHSPTHARIAALETQYKTTRDAVIPIHKMIRELETQGVVSKTHSPFNSPIWPVRKSDGEWRLTVDYRALNEVTPPLSAAVPDMLELQYELESKAAK